jgi:hypothetical protein
MYFSSSPACQGNWLQQKPLFLSTYDRYMAAPVRQAQANYYWEKPV